MHHAFGSHTTVHRHGYLNWKMNNSSKEIEKRLVALDACEKWRPCDDLLPCTDACNWLQTPEGVASRQLPSHSHGTGVREGAAGDDLSDTVSNDNT